MSKLMDRIALELTSQFERMTRDGEPTVMDIRKMVSEVIANMEEE
jgi:hypothetical protein